MKAISECQSLEEWALSFTDDEYRKFVAEKLTELSRDVRKPDFNYAYLFTALGALIRSTEIRVIAQESTNH